MTNQDFTTLAYAKSPKTSKRTTFQDELEAAVSARANKTKTQPYSDDFTDEEDDFLNDLLKSRKNKLDAFKAGRSKGKIITFDLSHDEETPATAKKVSFLKTRRSSCSLDDTIATEHFEHEPPDSSTGRHSKHNSSANVNEDDLSCKQTDVESANPQTIQESTFLSYQTSEDMPLPFESSMMETPDPLVSESNEEGTQSSQLSAADVKHVCPADSVTQKEPPIPKPRHRTLGQSPHTAQTHTDSQDLNRTQTSSASIPFSCDAPDEDTASPHETEEIHAAPSHLNRLSSSKSDPTKSTFDSGSRDGFTSDDSKQKGGKYSTSFEDFHEDAGDPVNHSPTQLSHITDKSQDTLASTSHSKSSQRAHSVCSRKVESKYLGTLKFLDRDVSQQDSQPEGAYSVRVAVYQDWLQKKKEKSRENIQLKKKEEIMEEKKKKEQEAKKEDAVASYEAWKEMKAVYRKAKAKEMQDKVKKEQRAIKAKEEKKQSAKQVFEKWKLEHDNLLKEKKRKEKEAEKIQNLQKQEDEEKRKKSCESVFSDWCEKKKEILHKKTTKLREELKTKAEEERYIKEERDKMALEMYESWLSRKDVQQNRQKEEQYTQAILGDSPPPWSPPSNTIPHR